MGNTVYFIQENHVRKKILVLTMGIDLYGKKCGHTKASRDMTSTHTGKSVLGFCFVLIDLMPPSRCPTVHSGQAEAHKAHISLFPQWQVWLKLHQVS